MLSVEHAAWAVFALVALVGFAFAKSLDDRDDRLEPRLKRAWPREGAQGAGGDFDKTERIPLRRVNVEASVSSGLRSSDRPSLTSDRPSAPGGTIGSFERGSRPGASDRPSSPSDRPTTAATRSDSTRRAFDRGSLPPE